MRDVLIHAPAAEMFIGRVSPRMAAFDSLEPPSLGEIIQMQQSEIRRLEGEVRQLRITAHTIAKTAACLAALAEPDHQEWVVVPERLRERMEKDVKLEVRSTPEGTEVRWVTRAPDHVIEGRFRG